jgi:large subunit ribosomal protein L29
MKAKDMREKSPEDLRELEKSLANDAFQSKLKNFTNRLDDTSQISKLRRDLARVKTLLGELARTANAPKAASAAKATKAAKPAASPAKAPAKKRPTKTAKAAHSEATK